MLVAGYHDNDDATRESMHAGYFSVGDLARRDAAGRYFIEGRKRDMVITGGVNVYPAEVENGDRGAPAGARGGGRRRARPGVGRAREGVRRPARRRAHRREQLKQFLRERIAGPEDPARVRVHRRAPAEPDGQSPEERAARVGGAAGAILLRSR